MIDVTSEIQSIARQYLRGVKPTGSENLMALCPFHDDTTASFAINIVNGVYFCHSCHAKGNLYTFLRDLNVPRHEIELKYKLVLQAVRKGQSEHKDPTRPGIFDLSPIPDRLLGLFDYTPTSLLDAGFKEETLRHFEVGYDRWHERVTYPLRDVLGNLVGISGRTIHYGVRPKYDIYTKQYEVWGLPSRGNWDKRLVLYNAHNVLPPLVAHKFSNTSLFLVEGFKAAMWLWQAGLTNVVALIGSYLSEEQIWQFDWLCDTVYIFLDNNFAGRKGTIESGHKLLNMCVRVMEYPDRLLDDESAQPDNLTPEELIEQYAEAKGYANWLNEFLDRQPTYQAPTE